MYFCSDMSGLLIYKFTIIYGHKFTKYPFTMPDFEKILAGSCIVMFVIGVIVGILWGLDTPIISSVSTNKQYTIMISICGAYLLLVYSYIKVKYSKDSDYDE